MSEHATGAIVTERQRCICPDDGPCLDHCRACNWSGRDLEEPCIADPDWMPDDDDLAARTDASGRRLAAALARLDELTPPDAAQEVREHAGKIAVQVDGICVDMEVTGFGGGERHVG